jgi:hypothetical protein
MDTLLLLLLLLLHHHHHLPAVRVLEFDWAYIKYADQKDPHWNQLRANWFNTEKRAGWKLVA